MPGVEIFLGNQELKGNLGVGMRVHDEIGVGSDELAPSGHAAQANLGDSDLSAAGIDEIDLQGDADFGAEVGVLGDFVGAGDLRRRSGGAGGKNQEEGEENREEDRKRAWGCVHGSNDPFVRGAVRADVASAMAATRE